MSDEVQIESAVTPVSVPVPCKGTIVKLTDKGELQLETLDPSGDQFVFLADIRALAKRVETHKPWARQEIMLLLENAANAGLVAKDLGKGAIVFKKAEDAYFRDMQTRNRLRYAGGSALGVILLVLIAALVVGFSQSNFGQTVAPSHVIISLFAFAGIGSMTSVLTRLSTLDLREETSRAMIFLSGGSKPLVAIGFAAIMYIIIKYQLISVSFHSGVAVSAVSGIEAQDAANAPFWVAAFLCGFSERFTGDLISRLEPTSRLEPSSNENSEGAV